MEQPIGVFDSGYGGLTVFKEIVKRLPEYDFIYLGDNARAPYGGRAFSVIYRYTLEAVEQLFTLGCPLVILACNTASAKALRNIQQNDLPKMGDTQRRVLGVVRPTAEKLGLWTQSKQVGIMATQGTVLSQSYILETAKFFPEVRVFQQACPMWVPLIESGEHESEGADFFVKKYIRELFAQSPLIDTLLLACTHYPLLMKKIAKEIPKGVHLYTQGEVVAERLEDYLLRHKALDDRLSKTGARTFLTTGDAPTFDAAAEVFFWQSCCFSAD